MFTHTFFILHILCRYILGCISYGFCVMSRGRQRDSKNDLFLRYNCQDLLSVTNILRMNEQQFTFIYIYKYAANNLSDAQFSYTFPHLICIA